MNIEEKFKIKRETFDDLLVNYAYCPESVFWENVKQAGGSMSEVLSRIDTASSRDEIKKIINEFV